MLSGEKFFVNGGRERLNGEFVSRVYEDTEGESVQLRTG